MAHQYMLKIFHDHPKNLPAPPPTYLKYVLLDVFYMCKYPNYFFRTKSLNCS